MRTRVRLLKEAYPALLFLALIFAASHGTNGHARSENGGKNRAPASKAAPACLNPPPAPLKGKEAHKTTTTKIPA